MAQRYSLRLSDQKSFSKRSVRMSDEKFREKTMITKARANNAMSTLGLFLPRASGSEHSLVSRASGKVSESGNSAIANGYDLRKRTRSEMGVSLNERDIESDKVAFKRCREANWTYDDVGARVTGPSDINSTDFGQGQVVKVKTVKKVDEHNHSIVKDATPQFLREKKSEVQEKEMGSACRRRVKRSKYDDSRAQGGDSDYSAEIGVPNDYFLKKRRSMGSKKPNFHRSHLSGESGGLTSGNGVVKQKRASCRRSKTLIQERDSKLHEKQARSNGIHQSSAPFSSASLCSKSRQNGTIAKKHSDTSQPAQIESQYYQSYAVKLAGRRPALTKSHSHITSSGRSLAPTKSLVSIVPTWISLAHIFPPVEPSPAFAQAALFGSAMANGMNPETFENVLCSRSFLEWMRRDEFQHRLHRRIQGSYLLGALLTYEELERLSENVLMFLAGSRKGIE